MKTYYTKKGRKYIIFSNAWNMEANGRWKVARVTNAGWYVVYNAPTEKDAEKWLKRTERITKTDF